jgi:hypothetical protein
LELASATVKRCTVDVDGHPAGVAHLNPLLNSRQYKVQYHDGDVETLTVNIIAESFLSQADEERHHQMMIDDEIIDHRATLMAIPKEKGTYQT